jgi:hypothetical protein
MFETMKYFFRLIRWPLAQMVILINWMTLPTPPVVTPEQRKQLDVNTAGMKLYHFNQCPFCVKTRRSIHRLGLNL